MLNFFVSQEQEKFIGRSANVGGSLYKITIDNSSYVHSQAFFCICLTCGFERFTGFKACPTGQGFLKNKLE